MVEFTNFTFVLKKKNIMLLQPPTINPVNLVVEGSSMTILCIAMGTPTPDISLYISGKSSFCC